MGLDMYLEKETYVQNWDHIPKEKQYSVLVTRGGNAVTHINTERVTSVKEELIFWRKANAIHDWFIRHCAENDVDDCKPVYVTIDDLANLLESVRKVLPTRDTKMAMELLPPSKGFFFGSDDIDDGYWDDLEFTEVELDKVIKEAKLLDDPPFMPDMVSYYYKASW